MGRPSTLHVGGTIYWVIQTRNPDTLVLKDADSTPTVAVRKNGSSVGDSVTITKRSATTGLYDCSYNPASEVEGDKFTLEESATVTGTTTSSATYVNSFDVNVLAVERGTDSAALASGVTVTAIGSGVITATSIAADAITDAKVASDVTIASVTGAVGSVTGNVGGNVVGSVASVVAGVDLSTTALGAIWNRLTSSLTTVGSIGKWILDNLTGDIYARLGAPTGASIAADIAAVKAETATIVVDTNELQTDWANGGRLDLILDARASQTSVDDIPTNAELATALATGVNVTQIDGSNLGTHGIGQFPADVRDWGGLGAVIAIDAENSAPSVAVNHIHEDVISADAISAAAVTKIQNGLASQTSVNDVPTNAELATALAAADDAVLAAIAALNNLSAAQVNAELLDVLNVDTFGELAAPPAANSTLRDKLTWIFMCHRNLRTETASQRKIYADNGSTLVGTEAVSDDGTTFTKGKVA